MSKSSGTFWFIFSNHTLYNTPRGDGKTVYYYLTTRYIALHCVVPIGRVCDQILPILLTIIQRGRVTRDIPYPWMSRDDKQSDSSMRSDRDTPSDTLKSRFCALLCVTWEITSQLIKKISTAVLYTLIHLVRKWTNPVV